MAEAALAEKPVEKKEAALAVLPTSNNRFSIKESGYAYAEVDVTQPVGHTVEDALRPEYWVHHAHKLQARALTGEADRTGARLTLRTDDHAHIAELYVRAVDARGLRVQLISKAILGGESKTHKGYEKQWNVGARGYDIIRTTDRQIVASASKIKTKEDVEAWIAEAQKAA